MASRGLDKRQPKRETIPFYRNVKTIGLLAQIVFAVVVAVVIYVLYNNVATALARSNLRSDFSFLDLRAGIPIGESLIPYSTSDPYWKAYLIGFLNTLKVALVGVALASLLGVLIGVMRLSRNWLLRQVATGYIELIRNTPLAVQIVFWYTAVIITFPPNIDNSLALPGGGYLSNRGLALPWVYTTYQFSDWLPWLGLALVVFIGLFALRRWQIVRSERPGNAWLLPLGAALLVAVVSYFVVANGSSLPAGAATDFRADRGRGTVFIDANGDGVRGGGERTLPFAEAIVTVEEGVLTTTSQNVTESRRLISGTFRFPLLREGEYGEAEVRFADPEAAAGLDLHFTDFPSRGFVYRDRDGDGAYDPGEEIDEATGRGLSGVRLELVVQDFERRVVADRVGGINVPLFEPVSEGEGEGGEAAASGGGNPNRLFTPSGGGGGAELNADVELAPTGPLLVSYPSVPTSLYTGGIALTTSFLALLLALVIYTASFIAEIVRAGIQAVPRGQTEAAKAVGLSGYQTFSLIVFPQALRIILPPMISQYLNLTKNSSLAPLIGYVELFAISGIIANQTGASVPVILLLIVSYLVISFTFAFVLNIVNARLTLAER